MKTRITGLLTPLLVALIALAVSACSTGNAATRPKPAPAAPTLEQAGATLVRYTGQDIEAAVSYRFAEANLGQPWLLIDVGATGSHRESTEIKHDKVSIKTPGGDIIPLPPQQELAAAFSTIRAANQRANIAAEPLVYWGGRRDCQLNLVVEPGTNIVQESVWVNDERVCQGRLYFPIPGGVQKGHYELRIDLKESKVRIPFQLGPRR
jgi:hypothetical protein